MRPVPSKEFENQLQAERRTIWPLAVEKEAYEFAVRRPLLIEDICQTIARQI